jgi:hypothetical protein
MRLITRLADLHSLPHWIVFDQERQSNGKKPRKVPFTPGTDRLAHVDKPATWRTYAEAVADAEHTGRHPGVALTPAMHLSLIDIDGQAEHELVAEVDSCTERSINGGLHIFVRGRPPAGFVAPAGIEVYPRGGNRFVLVTGDLIDGRDTIHDRTEVLAQCFPPRPVAPRAAATGELADADILERLRHSPAAWRLYRGDWQSSGRFPSQSEADSALCFSLRRAGAGSADQIDRLFRGGGLMRPKWDRHGTYATRTVAAAVAMIDPWAGWPGAAEPAPQPPKTGVVAPTLHDAATGSDPCTTERDTIAELRAENARLTAELATTTAERDRLSQLQSATMTLLRSRELRPGEKVIALAAVFDADAARQRGTTDPAGWSDAPLERLAGAGGCSADSAGRHLSTIATTGLLDTRTIIRRDPETGTVRRHRQIRLPVPRADTPTPELPERLLRLAVASPERSPQDAGWGGRRPCPACGDAGTVTLTTVACRGCGHILRQTRTVHESAPDAPKNGVNALNPQDAPSENDATTTAPAKGPKPHLAPTKRRGCPPLSQDAASGDAGPREPAWLRAAPPPWQDDQHDVLPALLLLRPPDAPPARWQPAEAGD